MDGLWCEYCVGVKTHQQHFPRKCATGAAMRLM